MKALFAADCTPCHGGFRADGNYWMSTYSTSTSAGATPTRSSRLTRTRCRCFSIRPARRRAPSRFEAYSQEKFYRATTLLSSVSHEMNKGNTTVAGGFSFSWNEPQLHPSTETELQLSTDAFTALTQTLTKTTVVQIGYEINQISGFQTDPFLRVRVNGVMTLGHVPDARTRHTLSARLRQALPADTYLEADYRHYVDNWQIDSNAVTLGMSHRFTPQLLAGFSYRWYDQSGVYFYAPQYVGTPVYYTSDFRLVPFDSGLYSGRLVITPRGRVFNLPAGTGLTLQYERYRTTTGFEAGIFTTGLRIPF